MLTALSAVLSFLGGNAFRLIFGEVVSFLSKKQDHALELERMRLQGDLEDKRHAREMTAIREQHAMGVEVIRVQRDADMDRGELDAWVEAVRAVGKQTGIRWLDAWNGSIRPTLASVAILMLVAEIIMLGWEIPEETRNVLFAVLGVYVADRHLGKRGK